MSFSTAGLTSTIAEHVALTPVGSMPETTIRAASRALLDGVGVILAASGTSGDVAPFIDLARGMGTGPSTILGTGWRATAPAAALANGAMAHALDYEDAFDPAPCHPNASLIPAALAVAELRGGVSGSELLAAIAIGSDLVCRMALSLRRPMEEGGWYPPPILGAFGAAAAAARLLELTPAQIADAFSLLLCQVSCPGEIKYSPETVIRAVREAFPAQAAVQSALLAKAGVRGFAEPLEGKAGFFRLYAGGEFEPSDLLSYLGDRYWVEQLSFKPWPACRGTHGAIELALGLRAETGFNWRDIDEILVEGGEVQRMLVLPEMQKKRPRTIIDAKFSLPFTVAVALVRGRVGLDEFEIAALDDPDILSVAAKVSFRERADWGRDRAAAAALEIRMEGGQALMAAAGQPMGHFSRPLSDEQLTAKFIDCSARASRPFKAGQALRVADELLHVGQMSDIGDLSLWVPCKM